MREPDQVETPRLTLDGETLTGNRKYDHSMPRKTDEQVLREVREARRQRQVRRARANNQEGVFLLVVIGVIVIALLGWWPELAFRSRPLAANIIEGVWLALLLTPVILIAVFVGLAASAKNKALAETDRKAPETARNLAALVAEADRIDRELEEERIKKGAVAPQDNPPP
jgi:hypothetical protein